MTEWEEPMAEQATRKNNNKQFNQTTEMKINVVIIGQGRESKRKGFYEESKRKMGSKVSIISTSQLAETERQCSTIQEGT